MKQSKNPVELSKILLKYKLAKKYQLHTLIIIFLLYHNVANALVPSEIGYCTFTAPDVVFMQEFDKQSCSSSTQENDFLYLSCSPTDMRCFFSWEIYPGPSFLITNIGSDLYFKAPQVPEKLFDPERIFSKFSIYISSHKDIQSKKQGKQGVITYINNYAKTTTMSDGTLRLSPGGHADMKCKIMRGSEITEEATILLENRQIWDAWSRVSN